MKRFISTSFLIIFLLASESFDPELTTPNRSIASKDINCFELIQNILDRVKSPDEITLESYLENTISNKYNLAWTRVANDSFEILNEFKKTNPQALKIFEEMGFKLTETKLEVPKLKDFVNKYEAYLDSKNIPKNQRIMPALTFRSVENENKLILHVPWKEPWLRTNTDWKMTKDVRLKGRDMTEALASGRFPIFETGFHDVFHFVSFAMYPEYAKVLRDQYKKLVKSKLNKSIINRQAYYLEVLTLANKNKSDEIIANITIKDLSKESSLDDFQNAVNRLSKDELNKKINFWILNYSKFITPYASGMIEPRERQIYIDRISFSNVYYQLYTTKKNLEKRKTNIDVLPIEMILEGMNFLDVYLKVLYTHTPETNPWINIEYGETTKDEALRLQLAKLEYALWKSSTEVNVQQWGTDTLTDSPSLDSPSMQFIKDVFGVDSHTWRLFTKDI